MGLAHRSGDAAGPGFTVSVAGLLAALGLVAVAFALALLAPARAGADPAATLYQPNRVDVIDLGLSSEAKSDLEAEPEEYVLGSFKLTPAVGAPAGEGPFEAHEVEIRLKGDASFKTLAGKAAFKLKFPKKAERPFGLKKMTLNNMVEDPSMTHETLAYTAFRAAGVPAPRTSFAYVYLNGVDYGLHLDVETLDDVALKNIFGSFDDETQHLYEGEGGVDVRAENIPHPGVEYPPHFEVDEGDEANVSDLEALVAADSGGPGAWSARIAPHANLEEMTRMWAVEKYVGEFDGYTSGEDPYQPNNYYLYSDPAGRFQMLPWGADETWQVKNHLDFGAGHGLLFAHCLGDAACVGAYNEAVAGACDAVGSAGLDALALSTADLLAPWQQQEQGNGGRHEHDLGEIADGVAETRAFVASRPAEAAAFVGAPCGDPPLVATGGGFSQASGTTGAAGPQRDPLARASAADAFGLRHLRYAHGVLKSNARLPGAGKLTQRVSIATAEGEAVVGWATAKVERARDLSLACTLSPALRERLADRWIRVRVLTRFVPDTGRPASITRSLTLPRAP